VDFRDLGVFFFFNSQYPILVHEDATEGTFSSIYFIYIESNIDINVNRDKQGKSTRRMIAKHQNRNNNNRKK